MRLPNGYGTVVKVSGNRKKPWRARRTKGWERKNGKNIRQVFEELGYYATKREAIDALTKNLKARTGGPGSMIYFSDVYEKFENDKYPKLSDAMIKSYTLSYRICKPISCMPIGDIQLQDLQDLVDNSGKNYPTLEKFKGFINAIFTYAKIHEYISQERLDNIKYLDISQFGNPNKITRTVFNKEEIEKLFKGSEDLTAKIILILIYSGVRVSELLNLKTMDVHLEERCFRIEKAKTNSGVRTVPIALKVLPFWKELYDEGSRFMFHSTHADRFTYNNFLDHYWTPCLKSLEMSHTPHDTRHTCISMMKSANVREHIIKKIVGHKGKDITDAVYTHVELDELLEGIDMI